MMDFILVNNTTANDVAANGIIPLGNAVHGCGKSIRLNGNGISVNACGCYRILVNADVRGAGAGLISAQLLENGMPIPGAIASSSVAANATVNLTIPWRVKKCCPCDSKVYTVQLSAAGTVTNITTTVEKV